MEFGFYPGCSMHGTAKEFSLSLNKVVDALGITLITVPDWSCCRATSAHATNKLLSQVLALRNLLQASKIQSENLLAPCAACYYRLKHTQSEVEHSEILRDKLENILGEKFLYKGRILNLIDALELFGIDKIKQKVSVPLKQIKAACYYGCLLSRPSNGKEGNTENPQGMEKIAHILGAETVRWNYKTECCGAAFSLSETEIVYALSAKILDDAIRHGANVIVTACPLCHSNLDMRQSQLLKENPKRRAIEVLYLTELIGLALGYAPDELGMNYHFVQSDFTPENEQTVVEHNGEAAK